jgi:hypothetical protein
MTNILILTLQLLLTNSTGQNASTYDSYGVNGWYSSNYCWQVNLTYAAPTGVYQVEWDYDPMLPSVCTNNGCWGMNPQSLNPPFTNAVEGTNTLSMPVIPEPVAFFRLRRVQI